MFGSRSRYRPIMCARYFTGKWVAGDVKKDTVTLLDLYKDYREWIADNAAGCELEVADFAKKLIERFPNATVKDGVVHGLAHYVEPPKLAVPPKTQQERDIEFLLSRAFHEHPGLDRKFEPRQIVEARPGGPFITEEQLVDYLEKDDRFFQHPTKKYWMKEWQG